MGHISYEEQKKLVFKGLKLLGFITIIEVFIALLFNGHIFSGFHKAHVSDTLWVIYLLGGLYAIAMIGMSLYKARFIVLNFMHLGSEVRGLRMSVLLPMLLLVWAIIAFFQEGGSWGERRDQIKKKNMEEVNQSPASGYQNYDEETWTFLG